MQLQMLGVFVTTNELTFFHVHETSLLEIN